jgi:ribonucleotide monophosphatase NagD (HAD superfamily)
VLCIGDSAEHDVAGGRAASLPTLLVMQGVSAGLDAGMVKPTPDYWMESFQW